ncbi:MAG: alcohol dehydrogenase catalytic domain-containing protein [Limnochordales bacterium]|nr:alcohol dehydrogenase catalytic domain-containing protein [Limnochordales bacterium]
MKQAYLAGIRSLTFRELPKPAPGPGQVLVRICAALTCGTDLKTYRRGHAKLPVPGPLGHEASGVVEAVGEGVTGFRPGDAVMWVPTAPCGACDACALELYNHCRHLFDGIALGAYADYLLLPERVVARHLFRKPDHLSFMEAALLEPLACIVRGWRRLGQAQSVAIIGVGAIGLLHVAVAKALGCPDVTVIGGRPSGLELAQRLGADRVIQGHLPAAAQQLPTGFAAPEAVIECTGQAEVWAQAPALVRPGGRVLLFGGLAGDAAVSFSARRIHYDEVTLLGSFHFTPADVTEAYRLLTEGAMGLGQLITGVRPLAELQQVFDDLEQGRGVKYALIPEGVDG